MKWNKDELLYDLLYAEQRLIEAQSKLDDPDYRWGFTVFSKILFRINRVRLD